jgi:hypothetical protein
VGWKSPSLLFLHPHVEGEFKEKIIKGYPIVLFQEYLA